MAPQRAPRAPRHGPARALAAALAAVAPALPGGGCAPLAAAGGAASASDAAALAGRLPAVAAGFRRGETRPAAGDRGSETAYATPGGRLTAAATVELLADDAPAAAALDAMLAEALRPVPPREMRDAGRFGTAAGAAPLLCARLEGRYGRERVAGLACAGRVGGALLRIRVTMPAREPQPADPRAFAEAVAAALSGSAPAG